MVSMDTIPIFTFSERRCSLSQFAPQPPDKNRHPNGILAYQQLSVLDDRNGFAGQSTPLDRLQLDLQELFFRDAFRADLIARH